MPRSSQSLLREFANIPRVTPGSAIGQATSGALSNARPQFISNRRGSRNQRGNPNEDINLQMARSLLATEEDEQQRQRLQGLIFAGDPETRKQRDKAGLFQWQQLVRAAADPRNPLSTAELDQAFTELNIQHAAMGLPRPSHLHQKNAEDADPAAAVANIYESVGKQFGVNPSELTGWVNYDKDTGQPNSQDVRELYKYFDGKQTGAKNKDYMSWLKFENARIRNAKKDMMQNPVLFDQSKAEVTMKPPPSKGFFETPEDFAARPDVQAYNDVRAAWDNLNEQEQDRAQRSAEAGSGFDGDVPTPLPSPGSSEVQLEQYTQASPFQMRAGTEAFQDAQYDRVQAVANQTKVAQYIFDPESNETFVIQPSL